MFELCLFVSRAGRLSLRIGSRCGRPNAAIGVVLGFAAMSPAHLAHA